MSVPSAPATPVESADPVAELQALWEKAYPPNRQRTRQSCLDGDIKWDSLQHQHLPLTLQVMLKRDVGWRDGVPVDPALKRYAEADPSAKALILMVGYSLEQVALCAGYHCIRYGCRHVVPFVSPGTRNQFYKRINDLLHTLGIPVGADATDRTIRWLPECLIEDTSDPSQVFRSVVSWIRAARRGEAGGAALSEFPVDSTGGQKPMDSGASAAAGFFNSPCFYLHFDQYDDMLRRPLPYTLRYQRLAVPSVAFSHHNRVALFRAIESAHFEAAQERLEDVKQAMDLHPAYFDARSRQNFDAVAGVVAMSARWFDEGYTAELATVENDEAQPSAPNGGRGKEIKRTPRESVEHLLELCGREPVDGQPAGWLRLFGYVVDEFHRLNVMREQNHHRDVVMGARGLAEVVVDSLFFLPWFRRGSKIQSIRLLETEEGTGRFGQLDREASAIVTSLIGAFVDKPMDPALLHLEFERKIGLLVDRKAAFTVKVAPRVIQDKIDGWVKVRSETKDTVTMKVKVVVPERMTIAGKSGRDATKKVWNDLSTMNFPAPWGAWAEARNAMTHLRSPMSDEIEALSNDVMEKYLPRIIEVLYRMGRTGKPVDLEHMTAGNWCSWQDEAQWSERTRVPWKREDVGLESLLEIEPLVENDRAS